MIDEDRVLRLLRSIADDTTVLRQEAGASEERRRDSLWLRGIKYMFVTAIEACVDVAQHICATVVPESSRRDSCGPSFLRFSA